MKHTFILSLMCLQGLAQLAPNTAAKFLDKNYVKARINTDNDKFWNIYGYGQPSYEVPKGKGTNAMFCNSIWIGGLDAGGLLHIAANTYKQKGRDFWPGPLDTNNIASFTGSNSAFYNSLWKVDCDDITNFVTAFNSGSVSANTYTIPNDILTYPAQGLFGFQKAMAPFVDVNGNGAYNPKVDGDYPLIKGHQQILSIYNDQNGTHGETGGLNMGLEIHERSYSYYEPGIVDSMQAINYTTFYNYEIYNRSNTAYHDVYISDWSDVDVGYFADDYIGTDTANNFAYCYNGENIDPNAPGVLGYGNKPPVMSHAILKTNCTSDGIDNNNNGTIDEPGEQFLLNKTTYYNNSVPNTSTATVNPADAYQYYNYMSGLWKDSTSFTYGGTGYGGPRPFGFVYTGDPATNVGWTESSAGNAFGDRRIILTSGPFNLPPQSKIEWGYLLVFSQDTSQAVNTITEFNTRVRRDVKNARYYDDTHQMPQCAPAVAVGIQQQEMRTLNVQMYPNPTSDFLTIDLSENVKTASVTLTDLSGRAILRSEITNGYRGKLDISMLEKGIYLAEVKNGERKMTHKVIKN